LGADALLAVGRASEHGPILAVVEWRGVPDRDDWDAVLVGKGVTFDSGGLNIKTAATGIAKMRLDMAGGAAVLGAVELAASRKAQCNVVAVVPMVENAVDGLGFRPGDVIGSLGGLTIEICNTDAEGRLVLADGIAYGLQTYKPAHIIDIATLTGTIAMVFLGDFAAVYANDDKIAADLDAAGRATGERLWRMPCEANQDYVVESKVADVANQSTFPGAFGLGIGAPMSGPKLLQKFVGDTAWAHIDIAGAVWTTRRSAYCNMDATGYGVRLLDQWLRGLETQ
jgi:leucyl aminopeptidase